MKKTFFFTLLFFSLPAIYSQNGQPHKTFFRLYEDNDALVMSGNATDWGYTVGNRIDFFYTNSKNHSGLFSRFNQLAGPARINTKAWGLVQEIIAPKRTSLIIPERNDYPYSGALFAVHTIHSANADKGINFQTEWIMGLMGPPSFARQTQVFFHRLIKDQLPMGWDYQLPADLLLNYNLKAEKLLAGKKSFGIMGGGEFFCGSMNDGISLHLLLQAGKKNRDYFSGLSTQYFATNKPNLSFSFRASADLIFYNALLQGGLFNSKSPVRDSRSKYGTDLLPQKITGSLDILILFSIHTFAVSFNQKAVSSEFKNYGSHNIGNISIYKSL